MITNKRIAANTARRLAMLLKSYGVHVDHYNTDEFKPIEKVLRHSWYVDKVKQMGHTDCIYIGIDGGFFAVLENGQIMTGKNIMILDGISCVVTEIATDDPIDAFSNFLWKGFSADEYDDRDYVVVCELSQFRKMLNSLNLMEN